MYEAGMVWLIRLIFIRVLAVIHTIVDESDLKAKCRV